MVCRATSSWPARTSAAAAPGGRQSGGRHRTLGVDPRGDDTRPPQGAGRGQPADDAGHVLVGHQPEEERRPTRREARAQLVEGRDEGLHAGRIVGAVEEHVGRLGVGSHGRCRDGAAVGPEGEQLEAPGPAGRRQPGPHGIDGRRARCLRQPSPRGCRARRRRWPPGADRGARGAPRPARPARSRSPARSMPTTVAGRLTTQRHPESSRAATDGQQPLTAGAGHGQVAALDDGRLLARDGGHAWRPGAPCGRGPRWSPPPRRHPRHWSRRACRRARPRRPRPPRGRGRRRRNAAAVRTSNSVGGPCRLATLSLAARTVRSVPAKSAGESSLPSTTIRSR